MNREQYRMIFRELRISEAIMDGLIHDGKRMLAQQVNQRFWASLSDDDFHRYTLVNNARKGNRHQVMSDDLQHRLNLYRYQRDQHRRDDNVRRIIEITFSNDQEIPF